MSLFDFKKKDDKSNLNPFSMIEDMGTRRAIESMAKILVGSLVAYAFARGWLKSESDAADITEKAVEAIGYAAVMYLSWRKAHRVEKEVHVASVMPAGTPRDVINDVAKSMETKDIAALMPPPDAPR